MATIRNIVNGAYYLDVPDDEAEAIVREWNEGIGRDVWYVSPVNELPMPGESFDDRTVIASCWQNDDLESGPLSFTLLVLETEPEFYALIEAEIRNDAVRILSDEPYANIISAAEEYADRIGWN